MTQSVASASYPNPNAAIKGLLGTNIEGLPSDIVAQVSAMSNEELFPLGEKALHDIADDIIVLAEIRNRFFQAHGKHILGYIGWKDFVEKNSRYSVRTIQRRLNEVNGVREYTKTEQTTNVVLPESTPENDSELAAILDVKPTAPVHRGRSKAQVAADASCAQKMMEHCGTGPVSSDTARLRKEFSGTGLELKTSTHGGRYDLCGLLPAQLKMIAPFLRDPAGWKKILRQITNGNI